MTPERGNEHFREALAAAMIKAVEFPRGVFVTLADARIRSNQKQAMGLLSVYPFDRRDEALKALKLFQRDLKDELAHSLKLRMIPTIEWKFDEREENVGQIDQTIAELKKKGDL